MTEIKTPPHSIEAEQSVLGGIFLGGDYDDIAEIVLPDDFYRKDHRIIFSAITELVNRRLTPDIVAVAEHLEQTNKIDEAGGLKYLGDLTEVTPSYANLKAYAEIVANRAKLRQIIAVSYAMAETAYNPQGKTTEEIVQSVEQQIFNLDRSDQKSGIRSAQDIVARSLDSMDERYRKGGGLLGISTGFSDLDRATLGLCKQDLIIIAGRPSMGKSALAFEIGNHAAIDNNLSVLGFSLEMPDTQIVDREIAGRAKIPFERIREGKLSESEWKKAAEVSAKIANSKLAIDSTAALTPAQIRSRARKHAAKHGLDLVIIDYLQLMQAEGERRDLAIGNITGQMKAMGKELNVPVVLLSQLSRQVENRGDRRPYMADLRDSGSIEQDADLIMFLYRDEVYNKTAEKGKVEVNIAKQRNGATGVIDLTFISNLVRFENYASPMYGYGSNAA